MGAATDDCLSEQQRPGYANTEVNNSNSANDTKISSNITMTITQEKKK